MQVEELQLKSKELDHQYPSSSGQIQDIYVKSESNVSSDQINKQELNLNIQHNKLMKSLEESEEEDEWYMQYALPLRRKMICYQYFIMTIKFDSKYNLK